MAAQGDDGMKKMFNNKEFTKMYAEGAEKFTGWYAQKLVETSKVDQVSDEENLKVLDLACGTGIVSKSLVDVLNDKQKANLDLTCADFADSMIDFVGPRIQTFGVKSAEAVKADAMDTKLPSDKYSHIFLNFGPMIYTDSEVGFRELRRMLQPGGNLAMASWKEVGWIDDVKAAFASDPEIPPFPEYEDFRKIMNTGGIWDESEWIKEHVGKAGFQDVQVREVPHSSTLNNVDEFARLMVGMVGMIQQRMWSKEQQEKYKDRANESVLAHMRNKYHDSAVKWDWVAIFTTAKKAA